MIAMFMEYFCETKVDKIDKILQILLEFSLRHNVKYIFDSFYSN